MAGKWHRDTSFLTATPSTVTSSSAAFGRWAFAIGQPRRDRRGRTDIVKGRSVRSGGDALTTLSCSASGIFAICCDLTRTTITRLARTFQSTRTRRRREQYMPLVAFCLRHFLADFIICMCEFDFRQAQAPRLQFASIAVMLAGAVEQCCPVIHQSPGRAQHLAGWTDVEIAFLIVGEVFAGERPIVAGRLVEHRNVRLDRVLINEPPEHLG